MHKKIRLSLLLLIGRLIFITFGDNNIKIMIKVKASLIVLILLCIFFSCKKEAEEEYSEKYLLLTNPVWVSDSLLANGEDASSVDQPLNIFSGETKFNLDGTGQVEKIEGTWSFLENETQLIIRSDSLPGAVTAFIKELTSTSLKIKTGFITAADPPVYLDIKMTFLAK